MLRSDIFRRYIVCEAYKRYGFNWWNRTKFFEEIKEEAYNLNFVNSRTLNDDSVLGKRWSIYLFWLRGHKWTEFKEEKQRNYFRVILPVEQINEFQKDVILYKLNQ